MPRWYKREYMLNSKKSLTTLEDPFNASLDVVGGSPLAAFLLFSLSGAADDDDVVVVGADMMEYY